MKAVGVGVSRQVAREEDERDRGRGFGLTKDDGVGGEGGEVGVELL